MTTRGSHRIAAAVRACAAAWRPERAEHAHARATRTGSQRVSADAIVSRLLALVCELAEARDGYRQQELALILGTSRPTISRDLASLRRAGMPIFAEREGQQVRYRLKTEDA